MTLVESHLTILIEICDVKILIYDSFYFDSISDNVDTEVVENELRCQMSNLSIFVS